MQFLRSSTDRAMAKTSVLFVCMGNICRSPTAEGVFRTLAARAGLIARVRVDSAATHDFYTGGPPDWRATVAARKRGYDIAPLRARQVEVADFARFDRIYAMDRMNLDLLGKLRPADCRGQLALFLELVPELGVSEVPDPYFGGLEGFERVLDLVEHASAALVEKLAKER
jgi:protein-tyrosine phosphatase